MASQTAEQTVLSRVKTSKGDPFMEIRIAKLAQPQQNEQDDAEWEYEYSTTETEVCGLCPCVSCSLRNFAYKSSRRTSSTSICLFPISWTARTI